MEIIPKKFSIEDIPERVNWINDPKISNHMYFELPATVEKTLLWYNGNIGNKKRVDFSFFDSNGEILAMGGYTNIDNIHKNAEFYVMVNPTKHRKGIGKNVSKWLYNYAFSILKLNKIFLFTNDDNIAASKIYLDLGFVLEGVLREHKWKNGRFIDRKVYGLLRSEWNNINWKEEIKNEF